MVKWLQAVYFVKGDIFDILLVRLQEKQFLLCTELAASWHLEQKLMS